MNMSYLTGNWKRHQLYYFLLKIIFYNLLAADYDIFTDMLYISHGIAYMAWINQGILFL